MTALLWLGIISAVLFLILGLKIISEMQATRALLNQMLGSIAEANWRIRDELTRINRSKEP